MCSLILYLYYTIQCLFCLVKIMLSPLGVVLRYTQGGLFQGKAGRFENEMTISKTKMKCRFLQQCAVFFCLYFYKKYFFCFLSYSPQCQMNSFRISGVHGTLLSQIIPLQYTILGIECQVRITLILFYYFSQHFITIFCATSHRYIFARFALYI